MKGVQLRLEAKKSKIVSVLNDPQYVEALYNLVVSMENQSKAAGADEARKGKPQIALLVAEAPFWEGASKGVFTICDTQKLCSAENSFYSVFSKTQLCGKKRVRVENKQKFTEDLGLFANMPKVVSCLLVCFFFLVLCFFLFVFLLVLKKKSPKQNIFLQFQRFFLFCSPKDLSLKSLSSSCPVFPCPPFVFPFKIPSFFLAFVHQPLLGKTFYPLRGAQFDFIFAVLRTLLSLNQINLSDLKTCTPVKGTP